MPDPRVEIPGGPEGLGPPTKLNKSLYALVIRILGAVLVIGVVGWLALALADKTMPDGLGVILGTVAGALVGLVSDKSS